MQVRHACLTAISKVLYVSTPAMLEEGIRDLPVSNFIGGLLGSRDTTVAAYAMQMAEVLMEKLPGIYCACFLKEGVVHALDQLAATAAVAEPAAAAASTSPEGDKAVKGGH